MTRTADLGEFNSYIAPFAPLVYQAIAAGVADQDVESGTAEDPVFPGEVGFGRVVQTLIVVVMGSEQAVVVNEMYPPEIVALSGAPMTSSAFIR